MNEIQLRILSGLPIIVPVLCMGADTARWLLFSHVTKFMAVAIGIGIGGSVLLYMHVLEKPRLLVAFFAPCGQLIVLRLAYLAFKRRVGRWPVDVAFNWSRGLALDRAFAFGTTLPSILIPVFWMGRY